LNWHFLKYLLNLIFSILVILCPKILRTQPITHGRIAPVQHSWGKWTKMRWCWPK
jgi:hypothetical protein